MTKKEFIDLFGEDPVDVLGGDWQNEIAEYEDYCADRKEALCVR